MVDNPAAQHGCSTASRTAWSVRGPPRLREPPACAICASGIPAPGPARHDRRGLPHANLSPGGHHRHHCRPNKTGTNR